MADIEYLGPLKESGGAEYLGPLKKKEGWA